MDQQYILIGIIAFIVNIWILFEIIKKATKSARYIQLQESQLKLLVQIAIKLGVSTEDVENSVNNDNTILKTRHDRA